MRERFIAVLNVVSRPAVAIGGAVVIGALIVGYTWYSSQPHAGTYAPVTEGPITQEVDVTGTVKAAQSTDLSFQTSGRVAVINVTVGEHVNAGQTLVALDTSTQAAATALAQANLEAQQANLASLTAGTRPQQLAIDQTAATQAQASLTSALQTAYASADDAVFGRADQVFSNPDTQIASLNILPPTATNPIVGITNAERVALNPLFASWQAALASTTLSTEALTTLSEANLNTVGAFIDNVMTALSDAEQVGSLSPANFVTDQTSISTGRTNVSAALSGLISANTAYTGAAGALTLAQAGATVNDIAAQQASVNAAQASLEAAQAAASQAVITAPVSGTITAQNANLGETVVPGAPLVSMIADGKYEADAEVSEADIAKLQVNDSVEVTFDPYPGATFDATLTTVDPAATIDSNGIASYPVTITFTNNDDRLKPGLSANLRIITATVSSALQVPSSAIITNGDQEFVEVKNGNTTVETPVTTGVDSSATGMTQILSGLTQGQEVLVFGADAQ